jgi:peptidoglycan/xylan/chitin deacetylase (PgdA/CDA1 family)/sulfur carrier protein ThiS
MAGTPFYFARVRAAFAVGVAVWLTACSSVTTPPASPTSPTPPPITVTVDGKSSAVPSGTTLATLIRTMSLQAQPGRLLSVTGEVLQHGAFKGHIELNGDQHPDRSTPLEAGDAVTVVDAKDKTEGVHRHVQMTPPRLGDPELTLTSYPMREVTTTGRVSGAVESITYRPIGHATPPGEVALSFDDGPWPVSTLQVLKILKHYDVPATFCMVGYEVQRYPSIAQAVQQAGMTICNHSWDHPLDPPLADLTPQHLHDELSRTNDQLATLGIQPTLFRPPGGSEDDAVVQEARNQGMRVVMWSVDPQDWKSDLTAKQVTERVLSHVQAGSIVLLHDGGGDAAHTIKALPAIIKGIKKMGLKLVTIPQLPNG